MIARSELFPTGNFGKPHGIHGELTAVIDPSVDPREASCVITDIDGIYVPFFIESIRPKGAGSWLLKLEGIDNDSDARQLVNRPVFMRRSEQSVLTGNNGNDNDDDDTMYASDLVGFTMVDTDGTVRGRIIDIDDSTANVLFIVENPKGGSQLLVPVADEFIVDIDTPRSVLTVNLPEGL